MRSLFCTILLLSLASVAMAADISGAWAFTVESDAGSGNPTFVFQQTGDKLAGTYTGAFGEAKLTGTVTGNKVEFEFEADAGGEKVKVKYTGTIEGAGKMKGTAVLGSLGSASWTAAKK